MLKENEERCVSRIVHNEDGGAVSIADNTDLKKNEIKDDSVTL